MTTTFVLTPGVGALPIRFGMTEADVASVLGSPERVTRTTLGEREEQRNGMKIRYSPETKCVTEISFLPTESLSLHGVNLFLASDPIDVLIRSDPEPFEWVGFVIFLSLGVAITGYHDNDPSQRAITVSEWGRWDAYREHFTPLRK